MSYQRIVVSTGAAVGAPGPLPVHLVGLAAETLADLPAALSPDTIAQLELADTGFLFVADPPPAAAPVRNLSPFEFEERFTQAERAAIEASADPVVIDFLHLLGKLPTDQASVSLDDPRTAGGVGYLEQTAHLIAPGRAAQILG